MHEEIAESFRVKADVFSSNRVMLAYQRTIANADHEPEGFLHGDIEGLLPYNQSDQPYPLQTQDGHIHRGLRVSYIVRVLATR